MQVKEIIKRQGYTLSQLAEQMHITTSAVSQSVNNDNIPISKLREIAQIIGCEVADFFADEVSTNGHQIICPHCGKSLTINISVSHE